MEEEKVVQLGLCNAISPVLLFDTNFQVLPSKHLESTLSNEFILITFDPGKLTDETFHSPLIIRSVLLSKCVLTAVCLGLHDNTKKTNRLTKILFFIGINLKLRTQIYAEYKNIPNKLKAKKS